MESIKLRNVSEDDLPIFFTHQLDADANHMAAFTAKNPSDRDAFDAHWAKILSADNIVKQTILYEERVVGHVLQFEQFGESEVSYWIDRADWGKGIATQALQAFLQQIPIRPLYARAVKDNAGSIRVLQKCGFEIIGEDTGFANARGAEVEEYIFRLPSITA